MTDHWLHHRLTRKRGVIRGYGKSLVVVRTCDLGHFDEDGDFIPCDEPQEFKDFNFNEVKTMDEPSKWQRFVDAWARLGR